MARRGLSIAPALVDSLYAESLLLADEARAWFDRARTDREHGRHEPENDHPLHGWSGRADPALRVALSCESLRLTTRLMHVIAWLLMQRAVSAGEIGEEAARAPSNRLSSVSVGDAVSLARLPDGAIRLIEASVDLHRRVALLESGWLGQPAPGRHPVHYMRERIASSLGAG